MFAVTMLNKKLIPQQWMSLLLLVCGVAAVQLSDVKEQTSSGQIFYLFIIYLLIRLILKNLIYNNYFNYYQKSPCFYYQKIFYNRSTFRAAF